MGNSHLQFPEMKHIIHCSFPFNNKFCPNSKGVRIINWSIEIFMVFLDEKMDLTDGFLSSSVFQVIIKNNTVKTHTHTHADMNV